MLPLTTEGEADSERSGEGDSPTGEDSRLLEEVDWVAIGVLSRDLGLSLPVGPFPSDGRLAAGKLSAALKQLFSSSSSDTRNSRAWKRGVKLDDDWK
jgi:hypothetical protein